MTVDNTELMTHTFERNTMDEEQREVLETTINHDANCKKQDREMS